MSAWRRAVAWLRRWGTLALAALCVLEAAALLWRVYSPHNSLAMTPLYRALLGEADGAAGLSAALAAAGRDIPIVRRSAGVVTAPDALDAIVHAVINLSVEKKLTPTQQKELTVLAEAAESLRGELAEQDQKIAQADAELRRLANEIAALLTPEQRAALLAQRDEAAQRDRDTAWQALAAALRAADAEAAAP